MTLLLVLLKNYLKISHVVSNRYLLIVRKFQYDSFINFQLRKKKNPSCGKKKLHHPTKKKETKKIQK